MSEAASQALTTVGKLRNAEAVEREAVSLLEVTGPQSLLIDALIRHGIALARLGQHKRAERALERAIATAVQLGTRDQAGLAALTMIEELDQLSLDSLLTAYERASIWLSAFQILELLQRINDASRKVLVRVRGKIDPEEALKILLGKN